jgi:hypothetical protein
MSYILTHWRGEQGLLRSTMLNGVLAYLVMITVLVSLGTAINLSGGIYVGLGAFVIWEVWAAVGIFRCGIRNVLERNRGVIPRIGGVLAILGVVAVVFYTADDMKHLGLFRWLY